MPYREAGTSFLLDDVSHEAISDGVSYFKEPSVQDSEGIMHHSRIVVQRVI